MSDHEWNAKRDAWVRRGCQGDEESFDAGWSAGRAYEAELSRLPLTDEDVAEQIARGLAAYAAPPHYGDTARPFPVDLSEHGDVRERWTLSDIARAAARGGKLQARVVEVATAAKRDHDARVDDAIRGLIEAGVEPGDIELLTAWEPVGDEALRSVTIVRRRQRPDPREIPIVPPRGGSLDNIRGAAMNCVGVERADIEQTGPASAVLHVWGACDLAEVRRAVDAARPGACDVRIRHGGDEHA